MPAKIAQGAKIIPYLYGNVLYRVQQRAENVSASCGAVMEPCRPRCPTADMPSSAGCGDGLRWTTLS